MPSCWECPKCYRGKDSASEVPNTNLFPLRRSLFVVSVNLISRTLLLFSFSIIPTSCYIMEHLWCQVRKEEVSHIKSLLVQIINCANGLADCPQFNIPFHGFVNGALGYNCMHSSQISFNGLLNSGTVKMVYDPRPQICTTVFFLT